MRPTLREILADGRPHLFDGAMGTMLYQKGVFINQCYDELNLKEPGLVLEIHREYIQAGAEFIETNSFGANRIKLQHYGLEDRVVEINARAAALAREAAGERALVGGAIGPLGIRIEPFGPTSREEARQLFREQAEGLLEGGVDFFVLETFGNLDEIHQALIAVRELSDIDVVCQVAIEESGLTSYGSTPQLCVERLTEWGADVVGFNCSVGPHGILNAVEAVAPLTRTPLSAQPNAGLPRDVHGRKIYMASPEYMAKYAQRLIRAGARLVGGCCGTTPEHIARMADVMRALSPGRVRGQTVQIAIAEKGAADDVVQKPLAARSDWGRKLAAGEFLTSVEITPPRGVDPSGIVEGARELYAAGVDAVNIPDGPRAQLRMSAVATGVILQQRVGIEPVVHYTCRDRNLLGMLSDLIGAHALGVRNLLLITGDPPKMGPYPDATAVFDIDSIGLVNLVNRLNRGLDPGGNTIGEPTSFTIGVGLNPAPIHRDLELHRFYWKVEAGAEYAITQPIFDPAQLLDTIEELRRREIWIPIVAGVWPLVSARNAEFLANEVPGITIPDEVLRRMQCASAHGREAALAEGIEIARETIETIRPHVQGVQINAPFGRIPLALELLRDLLGNETTDDAPPRAAVGMN